MDIQIDNILKKELPEFTETLKNLMKDYANKCKSREDCVTVLNLTLTTLQTYARLMGRIYELKSSVPIDSDKYFISSLSETLIQILNHDKDKSSPNYGLSQNIFEQAGIATSCKP